MVEATRGTGGGYRLHRPPQDIRLIEVVELFEGAQKETKCLLDSHATCSNQHPCSAHQNWEKVTSAYVNFLDTTTLADIACGPHDSFKREESL
jgi:Rrf2 family protein